MKLVKIFVLIATIICVFSLKNLKNDKEKTVISNKTDNKRVNDKYIEGNAVSNGPVEADVIAKDGLVGSQFIAERDVTALDKNDSSTPVDQKLKPNPPKPLANATAVPLPQERNAADKANTSNYGLDKFGNPPKRIELDKVTYVKDISPVGRAALELSESGDVEYQKLLNAGFETPKTSSQIIGDTNTNVGRPAEMNYFCNPTDPSDKNLWQNVEFNKYNNRLLDTTRYITPAKFERNMFGNIIVHAPSDSRQMITTPAKAVLTTRSGFLSIDENEKMALENDIDDYITEVKTPDQE